ncbi:MAG TPA: YaaR family protein [Clostridiales bacterium]|nr:YaaR family protein [Clostridiales bacterium]
MSIKISEIHQQNHANRLFHNENTKSEKGKMKDFASELIRFQEEKITERLQTLLSEIDVQAQKLQGKLYLQDLITYKKLVKDFLSIAARNSYQLSKENFLDRKGRHRVLSTIKKVDSELEALTREFLKTEKDRMKILQKLDDIRGLLIDIFM